MKILYVEGDNTLRGNLVAIWRLYGYDAIAVATIAEASAQIASDRFDRIICGEVGEPGDGPDLAKQLTDAGKSVVIFARDSKRNARDGVRLVNRDIPKSAEERIQELFSR